MPQPRPGQRRLPGLGITEPRIGPARGDRGGPAGRRQAWILGLEDRDRDRLGARSSI